MAERKAVNKYYPPDWDPRKGSVNKRVGQHPLRDRARKLSQGILVIRFELPYNIWCGGCGNHVGMGVRYNAEKSKVGNYYSTPIYKFRMKCHLCDNYFEIQTDPKNHDYVILSGARRKEQRWDPVANEQIVPEDKATQKKMAMDAMYKLEHGSDDVQKGKDKKKSLAELESSRLSMRDDYMLNRMARDRFRAEKKVLKAEAEADQEILNRGSLSIDLVDETEGDRNLASLLKYSVTSSFEDKQKEKRRSIEQRPLFDANASTTPAATSSSSSSSSTSSHSADSQTPGDRGNAKKKLGQILKTSGKDPFHIGKSSNIFKTSQAISSSLGIRIKSSKASKIGGIKPHSLPQEKKALTKAIITKKPELSVQENILDSSALSQPCSPGSKEQISLSTPQSNSCSYNVSTNSGTELFISLAENKEISCDKNKNINTSCDTHSTRSTSKFSSCDFSLSTENMHCKQSETLNPSSSSVSHTNSALTSLMESYDDDEGTSDSSDS